MYKIFIWGQREAERQRICVGNFVKYVKKINFVNYVKNIMSNKSKNKRQRRYRQNNYEIHILSKFKTVIITKGAGRLKIIKLREIALSTRF